MYTKRVIFVGLLVAALIVVACSPQATTEPTTRPPTAAATPADTTAPTATPGGDEVRVGFTEEGAPYRGDPDAPVTLLEFSEFQ
jgi:hypothetical protein